MIVIETPEVKLLEILSDEGPPANSQYVSNQLVGCFALQARGQNNNEPQNSSRQVCGVWLTTLVDIMMMVERRRVCLNESKSFSVKAL